MKILILALPILSMGCVKPTEREFLKPEFPPETLTQCPISARKVQTVKELAALATEHLRSAECANGKIAVIAEVLKS